VVAGSLDDGGDGDPAVSKVRTARTVLHYNSSTSFKPRHGGHVVFLAKRVEEGLDVMDSEPIQA
jgi:hypothetical protein